MMVADMTTYMAKLVSKLTQTAATHANNIIKKTEEANILSKQQVYAKSEPIRLAQEDLLEFQSNLQLLDDAEMDIPNVVQKI